jgi:hemerythrin superfamily protein
MPAAKPKDAIALLMADHKEVQKLFKQYEKLSEDDAPAEERKALAAEVCFKLIVHAQLEEELFYPAAREALPDDEDLLDEAEVEHASAKQLMAEIAQMQPDDKLYDAKVIVLGEYVNHHVKEEEGEMFPKLKKSEMDLAGLGQEMTERKEALMSEAQQAAAG